MQSGISGLLGLAFWVWPSGSGLVRLLLCCLIHGLVFAGLSGLYVETCVVVFVEVVLVDESVVLANLYLVLRGSKTTKRCVQEFTHYSGAEQRLQNKQCVQSLSKTPQRCRTNAPRPARHLARPPRECLPSMGWCGRVPPSSLAPRAFASMLRLSSVAATAGAAANAAASAAAAALSAAAVMAAATSAAQ